MLKKIPSLHHCWQYSIWICKSMANQLPSLHTWLYPLKWNSEVIVCYQTFIPHTSTVSLSLIKCVIYSLDSEMFMLSLNISIKGWECGLLGDQVPVAGWGFRPEHSSGSKVMTLCCSSSKPPIWNYEVPSQKEGKKKSFSTITVLLGGYFLYRGWGGG